MRKQFYSLFVFLAAAVSSSATVPVTITLSNPLNADRTAGEMIELSAADLAAKLNCEVTDIAITTNDSRVIPSQVTHDGMLIFPRPDMKAKEKLVVMASPRHELPEVMKQKADELAKQKKVFGRLYPERQNDFSFENDRLAYRLYGPDTQKKGERLYGYDIFNKSTQEMVLDELYAGQCDGQMWSTINKLNRAGKRSMGDDVYYAIGSYHVDHGKGMDCYKVGPTLGAGADALISITTSPTDKKADIALKKRSGDGTVIYPWCFTKAEVLDNGPLRLTVRLTYSPITVAGKQVTETRTLTVDAGSSMVKADVQYDGIDSEMAKQLVWCTGIAVHKEHKSSIGSEDNGIIAYEDYGDSELYIPRFRESLNPQMGSAFIGCVVPNATCTRFIALDKPAAGTDGHIMAIAPLASKPSTLTSNPSKTSNPSTLTYYFGNCWSRNATIGITTMDQWFDYLKAFAQQVKAPVKKSCK